MGDQEKGETVTSGGRLFARDSLSIHRVVPEHPVLQQGFEDINQPAVNISWAEAVSIADAMRGHLPTEAQWEFAARGPMVNVTEQMRAKGMDLANIAGFPYLVRGPYIAGRIERGFFGHYENFVAMDPVTGQMIGTEFFTDPNHLRIQQMLREGQAIGAWRVFSTESGAFKEAAIWSSVMRQRFSTRYVMEGKPGPFGLIDMNGNVSEWMNDWYGPYDTPGKVIQNPMGQMNGYYRVSRGGSWVNLLPRNLRAAYRNHCRPDKRTILVGLRVLVPQD